MALEDEEYIGTLGLHVGFPDDPWIWKENLNIPFFSFLLGILIIRILFFLFFILGISLPPRIGFFPGFLFFLFFLPLPTYLTFLLGLGFLMS